MNTSTEIRTYTGLTGGPGGFDGYAGLVIGRRYTGVPQENGAILVAVVGAPMGAGIKVSEEEWGKWFKK